MQIRPGLSTGTSENVTYRLDKLAAHVSVAGHWLDCGGADGNYANGLLARGAEKVTITDIDPARVGLARERWGADPRLSFQTCPAEHMPFDTATFDGVLLNEVLEHVDSEYGTLGEIRRVLKPHGRLAVFSPSRRFPFEGHGLNVYGRPVHAPAPLVPWLPKSWTSRFVKARNYWPAELRRLVCVSGFVVCRTDYALPVLTNYPWLPRPLVRAYQRHLSRLDRSLLRQFGVSTLILACRAGPGDSRFP